MDLKTKIIFTCALIFVGLGLVFISQSRTFGQLRMVFCDVGQGDGMLIISPGGREAIVDAGQGTKILDCLSGNMPFWDREIELIVPTHPHQEHMEGFLEVLSRYKVKNILTTNVANDTNFYKVWQESAASEGSRVYEPDLHQMILLDPDRGNDSPKLEVLAPSKSQIEQWKRNPPSDLNDTSIVMRLSYGNFCAYLTGDLPKELIEPLIDRQCQVLKVVHHGSRTGTSDKLIEEINPKVAVIQVGKNNQFGHPTREVLDILTSHKVQILRNDLKGTIEIDSDGVTYSLK